MTKSDFIARAILSAIGYGWTAKGDVTTGVARDAARNAATVWDECVAPHVRRAAKHEPDNDGWIRFSERAPTVADAKNLDVEFAHCARNEHYGDRIMYWNSFRQSLGCPNCKWRPLRDES